MQKTMVKQQNLSLEFTKLVAACFVVFIHAGFPGKLGAVVDTVARFAVPFFFAVSGYYSMDIGPEKIKKRGLHILKLHLITAVLSVIMACVSMRNSPVDLIYYLRHGVLPTGEEWIRWLTLQENPYGGHLWYLSSLLLCYGVLWVCRTFQNRLENGPLYQGGFTLFALFFLMSLMAKMEGMTIPFMVYRSGWIMGIPMFTMGMFLCQYRGQIVENFRLTNGKMVLLMGLGLVLSITQCLSGHASEMPLGMMLLVPVLLLFLQQNPRLPLKSRALEKVVARFGVVSTAVYLLHIAAIDVYNWFLKETALAVFGAREELLMPLVVLAMTFVGAFLWERVDALLSRKSRQRL